MLKRTSIRCCLLIAAAVFYELPLLSLGTALAEPDAKRTDFHFQQVDDKSLGLWERKQPVLVYNFGKMRFPGDPAAAAAPRSSYVHPIYGLDGEVLTDDFPADHYHHHGLFWGWPHVRICGHEYDLWTMRGIRIEFQRWLVKDASRNGATLRVENGWFVSDKQAMKEEIQLKVHPASAKGRHIDIKLAWTPLDDSITLGGAEGKSYGGLTLRFAPRIGTVITVPSGRVSQDLLMTRMPWADLSAHFLGAPGHSGMALFVSPRHPDFPSEWMTRDYGLLAVGWPGVKPETLLPGKTVTCRYRLWIHHGTPDAAEIQRVYDAFTIVP